MARDLRFQGRHVGTGLLRTIRLMAFGLPIGCRFLALEVDESNAAARALYERENFRIPEGYETPGGRLLMLYDLGTTRPATAASPIDVA